MITVEAICLILVTVGSLGLFYYLGWLAGKEYAVRVAIMQQMVEGMDDDE